MIFVVIYMTCHFEKIIFECKKTVEGHIKLLTTKVKAALHVFVSMCTHIFACVCVCLSLCVRVCESAGV